MMSPLQMQDDTTKDNDEAVDEAALFQREMQGVKPLKADNRMLHITPRKAHRVKQAPNRPILDDVFPDAPVEDCPESLRYSRSGVQPATLKKLRQGKLPIDHVIDLHGMTVEQARSYLLSFLAECEADGSRCVLIVHGKGYSSPGAKPVIKPLVNRWLPQLPQVLAFSSALPSDGGTGAVYVLLKKQSKSKCGKNDN